MSLTDADEYLETHEYPATTTDLIDAYGEKHIELPNGTETVADVLSRVDGETYESAEDARYAIYAALSTKAIGRIGYSDRDPAPLGSPYAPTPVSF